MPTRVSAFTRLETLKTAPILGLVAYFQALSGRGGEGGRSSILFRCV